jgi:hypothetical protein
VSRIIAQDFAKVYCPAVPVILEGLVLGLLTLIPAFFYLGTTEQFEFPKTELLATGDLVMLAVLLAERVARASRPAPAGGIRATRA